MSSHTRTFLPLVFAVAVAIGCGSSKPQDAAATQPQQQDKPAQAPAQPLMQLAEAPAGVSAGSGSIKGSVKFEGTAPAAEKVKMGADPVCQQQHATPVMTEDVAVNSNNTLKNVFVYVKEGVKGAFPASSNPVILEQKGCWYAPHVFGIQVDQSLEITNDDPTLHNVNAKPTVNQPFNVAQPSNKSPKVVKKFAKPELGIVFKCNVHPWMKAYGNVVDNPFFAVTGEDGSFAVSGLPAGTYTIAAWHEKYGTQTQSVTVGDGQAASADFTFKAQ